MLMDKYYLGAIIAVISIILLLIYYFINRNNETYTNIMDNEKKHVVLFFSKTCGQCNHFMDGNESLWNTLKNKYSNNSNIEFTEVDCDEQPTLATKHLITKYPTIKLLTDNNEQIFSGDRNLESLERFIN